MVKVSIGSNLPARARQVSGRNLEARRQRVRAGRSQDLFPVEYHAERAVREAGEHTPGAGAVQVVGILDFDNDRVVDAVGVGDNER